MFCSCRRIEGSSDSVIFFFQDSLISTVCFLTFHQISKELLPFQVAVSPLLTEINRAIGLRKSYPESN